MTPIIGADNLVLRYPRTPRPQISGLTFQARSGVTALIGRNGAGKSTLMKALVSLKRVDAGALRVFGINPSHRRERADLLSTVGYLQQQVGFVPHFTVTEFVAYGAWLKKVPTGLVRKSVAEAIERVGLTHRMDERLGRLSGGMVRRAGIAQSIVHAPKLLILDEPTAGLDPEQRIRFRALVSDLAQHQSILLSSHLIEDVRSVANDVLVLDDGGLRYMGSVTDMEALAQPGDAGESALERAYSRLISKNHTS